MLYNALNDVNAYVDKVLEKLQAKSFSILLCSLFKLAESLGRSRDQTNLSAACSIDMLRFALNHRARRKGALC